MAYPTYSHRLCLKVLAGGFICMFGAMVALSYFADPFSLYHSSDYIPPLPQNNARLALSSYSNISKPKRIILEKPDHILLGNSIVDHGFRLRGSMARWYNPFPELTQKLLQAGGPEAGTYYNAAIRGGGMQEMWDCLRLVYQSNPKLDSVIFGTEYGMLYSGHSMLSIPPNFLNGDNLLSFSLEYLLSPLAMRNAYDVLYESHGFHKLRHIVPAPDALKLPQPSAAQPVTQPVASHAPSVSFTPSAKDTVITEQQLAIRRFVFSAWYANSMHQQVLAGNVLPEHVATLQDYNNIVEFCHKHGIKLQVYLSPQPPVFWAIMRRFGLQNNIDNWYRTMSKNIAVWDFNNYFANAPDIDTLFTTDTLHFSQEGGEMILSAILGHKAGIGKYITQANVEQAITERKLQLATWETSHRDIMDAVNTLPSDMTKNQGLLTGSPPALCPVLMEPEYKGYRVVMLMGYYVAVPSMNAPPYNGYKLISGQYPGMLKADNEAAIIKAIDSTHH